MDILGIGFVRTLLLLLFICVGGCESQGEGSVRIVGGPSPREGRVEIYFEDLWSTVSVDEWTNTEAVAVCRQLGFDGSAARVEPEPAVLAIDIPILSVNCPGGASSLTDCDIQKTAGSELEASLSYLNGQTYWDHSQIAGVKCENAVAGPSVVQIVLNVIGLLVVIAVICLFGTLFYRFKKRHVAKENKPPEAEKPESVAMYATRIGKSYQDNPEGRTHHNPEDPPDQYCRINPIPVELENSYLQLHQGDNPQQYSTRIEKNYAEVGEDQAQEYITIDPTEDAQQYLAINTAEVEPENSYEMPKTKDPTEQTSV